MILSLVFLSKDLFYIWWFCEIENGEEAHRGYILFRIELEMRKKHVDK